MVNLRNIKNIIFDLGGVILDIKPHLAVEEFKAIGFDKLEFTGTSFHPNALLNSFESGQITPHEFREEIKKTIHTTISDEQINSAWNKMIMEFSEDKIRLIQQLKPRFKLFLLSNTNQIHFDFYNRNFRKHFTFNFSVLFTKTYYSFKLNLRKPDAAIFLRVLEENRLNPDETLFIDDSKINTDAAEKLGINTHWLSTGETINSIGLL